MSGARPKAFTETAADLNALRKLSDLSPRLFEVYLLLGQGFSPTELANIPGHKVSVKTIAEQSYLLQEALNLDGINLVRVQSARLQALYHIEKREKAEKAKWNFI